MLLELLFPIAVPRKDSIPGMDMISYCYNVRMIEEIRQHFCHEICNITFQDRRC